MSETTPQTARELAEVLKRTLGAIERGELDASAAQVAALSGALEVATALQ